MSHPARARVSPVPSTPRPAARPAARPGPRRWAARGGLLAGLLAGPGASPPAAAVQPPVRDPSIPTAPLLERGGCGETAGRYRLLPLLLRVTVNGRASGRAPLFLRRPCGALLARDTELEALRIRTAGRPVVLINGQRWLNLNEFPGLTYALDSPNERLVLEGEPRVFYPTVIDFDSAAVPVPDRTPLGGFLNYGAGVGGRFEGERSTVVTGSLGLGLFGPAGVLTGDVSAFRPATGDARVYRVGTTFTHDDPARSATLRVGDLISRAGIGGTTALLGGVQYGTNFLLRPYRIITPVTGFDTALSRDGRLRVGATAFGADPRGGLGAALPVPYGPVEVRGVSATENIDRTFGVRQGGGPEQLTTTRTFYAQGLLKQGLSDYSYEAGALRTSLIDDRYGALFVGATQRYGVTRWFTGEVHADGTRNQGTLGLAAALAVPYVGVVSPGVAHAFVRLHGDVDDASAANGTGSNGDGHGGNLLRLSVDNRYQRVSWFGLVEFRDRGYRNALDASFGAFGRLRRQEVASVSYTLPWEDNATLSYYASADYSDQLFRSVQLSYSTLLLHDLLLSAYVARRLAGRGSQGDTSYGLFANLPLRAITGRVLSPETEAGLTDSDALFNPDHTFLQANVADATRGAPTGSLGVTSGKRTDGGGYLNVQLQQGLFQDGQTSGGAFYSGPRYYLSGRLAHAADASFYSLAGGGGLVFMDGGVFAAPPLSSGFALVRLGSQNAHVRVGDSRTNADGDAVVTGLTPYVVNAIGINPQDLPFNTQLDGLNLAVVPRFRSGVVVHADIRAVRDVLVKVLVVDRAGRKVPLPLGASALVDPPPGGAPAPVAASAEAGAGAGANAGAGAGTGAGDAGGLDAAGPVPSGRNGLLYFANVTTPTLSATVTLGDQHCRLSFPVPPPDRDDIPELGPFLCEGITP